MLDENDHLLYILAHTLKRRSRREDMMRVALLVGVLMFDMFAGLYDMGWLDDAVASPDDAGQVRACDDAWPPPPPPASFP
jgi:hypothetical protein